MLRNRTGVECVADQHWLTKKDAARFFARMSYSNKLYGDPARLDQAVEDGLIRTKTVGKRMKYNMLDCMNNCRIF